MTNYEKHKFLKEKLNAPRFDNEDEEREWYAKHLYGLYHQASRLREENNYYKARIDKYKSILDKIKEYCNNRLQYYNEMKRDYDLLEFDGNAENDNENILELLEEIE